MDWVASMDDIQFSYKTSRMLAYNGMASIPVLKKTIKQYVIYYYLGRDILRYNNIPNSDAIIRDCFNELFVPTEDLFAAIEKCGMAKRSYVSAHLRFVNALEHFEDGVYNSLSQEKQLLLIQKCLDCLHHIQKQCGKPLLVFSDSNRFLQIAKEQGFMILDGNVGHVSFNADRSNVLKTFLDFYMIGRSDKVFRIISKEMYGTTFSLYASVFGNCELETLNI